MGSSKCSSCLRGRLSLATGRGYRVGRSSGFRDRNGSTFSPQKLQQWPTRTNRSSQHFSVTAAGPPRIRTGVPCSSTLKTPSADHQRPTVISRSLFSAPKNVKRAKKIGRKRLPAGKSRHIINRPSTREEPEFCRRPSCRCGRFRRFFAQFPLHNDLPPKP